MKYLYKFHWDCGWMGSLDGLFLATTEQVEDAIGHTIYFGEVLGKHSDIYGPLCGGDIVLISESQALVSDLAAVFESDTLSGYNPIEAWEDYKTDNEDED